jgi:hypothetical protein
VAIKLLKNYAAQKQLGLAPVFYRDMLPELSNIELLGRNGPGHQPRP